MTTTEEAGGLVQLREVGGEKEAVEGRCRWKQSRGEHGRKSTKRRRKECITITSMWK